MKNIIETHKKGAVLEVTFFSTFNLRGLQLLEDQLNENITNLQVDLSYCDLIDSKGVIFLHKWQHSGKKLKIKDPPPVFFEILDILELKEYWDLENIITP